MGVLGWLKKTAGTALKGLNWFGQNIGKPLLNFSKNIPLVGDVVKAAEPLLSTVSKTSQWAEDKLGGVAADKRRAAPTVNDFKGAIDSAVNTGKTIASKIATKGMV
jgi:hypothetical protein